jgi:hypothetical protein
MQLSNRYRGYCLNKGTLSVKDLIYPCLNFLLNDAFHPQLTEKIIDIERQLTDALYLTDKPHQKEKMNDIFLDEILDLLSAVSPKGCFFGSHPGDPGRIGFWDKPLR